MVDGRTTRGADLQNPVALCAAHIYLSNSRVAVVVFVGIQVRPSPLGYSDPDRDTSTQFNGLAVKATATRQSTRMIALVYNVIIDSDTL